MERTGKIISQQAAKKSRDGGAQRAAARERVILLAVLLLTTGSVLIHITCPFGRLLSKGSPIRMLILSGPRSCFLAQYSPRRRHLAIIPIPMPTRIESRRVGSLPRREAISKVVQAVEDLFSFDIPFWMEVNAGTPEARVEARRDLSTHEAGGEATLLAEKLAELHSRWSLAPQRLKEIPSILLSRSRLQSNIGLYGIGLLLAELYNLPLSRIHVADLPGKRRGSHFLPDRDAIRILREKILEKSSKARGYITAEVLNATDRKGLALRTTKLLRLAGVDVVHFGNHSPLLARTRIIDRTGSAQAVKKVRRVLGLAEKPVATQIKVKPFADICVILGEDFKEGASP